jgi:hypothetical protein
MNLKNHLQCGTEPFARMQLTKLYRNWNYQERIKPEVDLDNLQNSLKHKYNLAALAKTEFNLVFFENREMLSCNHCEYKIIMNIDQKQSL